MGECSWDFEILELLRLRRPQGKLGNFLREFM